MTRQQLIERWGKWSKQAVADGEIFYYISDVKRFEEWYFQGLTL
jgi:hypothetical protein